MIETNRIDYFLFTLSLTAAGDDATYRVDARFTLPGSAASTSVVKDIIVTFNLSALLVYAANPVVYGTTLSKMLFADEALRRGWYEARGAVRMSGQRLRFVLNLDMRDALLSNIRWELLRDPDDELFLFASESIIGSRLLESSDLTPIRLRTASTLRALIVIADPVDLANYNLVPIDVDTALFQIRAALGPIPSTSLVSNSDRRATLTNLAEELREGCDIFYLLAHGHVRDGEPYFFLENESGSTDIVGGAQMTELFRNALRKPLLCVLVGSNSLGKAVELETGLAAPWFIAAGVPAVLGMQGNVSMRTVGHFMPTFFRELRHDGQVDRAVAVARLSVRDQPDWWSIVLFLRLPEGRLWEGSALSGAADIPESYQAPRAGTTSQAIGATESRPLEQSAEELLPTGMRQGAFNDETAREDWLEVAAYISAFADLVEARDTQPPLTIGVYGSWGMGKSFILNGIAREVERRRRAREERRAEDANMERAAQLARPWTAAQLKAETATEARARATAAPPAPPPPAPHVQRVHVVTFNAWEYSANEVVWPGLVRAIMDKIETEQVGRYAGKVRLRFLRRFLRRLREERGRILVVGALSIAVAVWVAAIFDFDPRLVAAALASLGAVGLIKIVSDTMAEPLSKWVSTLFQEEEYGKQIGYMSSIRDDIDALQQRLARHDARMLIIIDDLDRCEPGKAVEVLQALRLLLSFQGFVIVLGIDARVITKAIEKHYDGLLGEVGASGYEYLDKIVQIPFQIPRPETRIIKGFIAQHLDVPAESVPATTTFVHITTTVGINASLPLLEANAKIDVSKVPHFSPEPPASAPGLMLPSEPAAFSRRELSAFEAVSEVLRPNPRHLKRLINVYWLVRTLTEKRGKTIVHRAPQAVISWLVISSQWPCVAYAMTMYLERIIAIPASNGAPKYPAEAPLPHLFNKVHGHITGSAEATEKLRRLHHLLDDDLTRLQHLIAQPYAAIEWADLVEIRPYTIHFNPAVEAELRSAIPSEIIETRLQQKALADEIGI